jgi:hypothetical protein
VNAGVGKNIACSLHKRNSPLTNKQNIYAKKKKEREMENKKMEKE